VAVGVALVEACRAASPTQFAWRDPPYEYESVKPPIDILYGSTNLREAIDAGRPVADLVARWKDEIAPFLEVRKRYLLY
jgi:uncharacterized protein YbbC (DUF1343 family)